MSMTDRFLFGFGIVCVVAAGVGAINQDWREASALFIGGVLFIGISQMRDEP